MSTNTQPCAELANFGSNLGTPQFSPEVAMWFEVIKVAMWDYGHLRREFLTRPMKQKRVQKLNTLTQCIFTDGDSIHQIAKAVATNEEYLMQAIRRAVSDEQIETGYILGRKMRKDDPVKGEERDKRYTRSCG